MNKEKGITLTSLVLYMLVFITILGLLAALSGYIYSNVDNVSSGKVTSEEFNKFNLYFIKDVKQYSNATVTSDTDVTISFGSDVKYTYKNSDRAIYRNKVKIASNIANFTATLETDSTHNSKKVINVNIQTGKKSKGYDFSKNIKYVLKYW